MTAPTRQEVVENTILEALTDPEFTIERHYAEKLLKEYAEAKTGQHETIVMYAIFKGDDLLEHTIRRTARDCWHCFENEKNAVKELLKTDEKEYGYKCKQLKVSK